MLGAWPLRLGRRGAPSLLSSAGAFTRSRAAPHAGLAASAKVAMAPAAASSEVLVEEHGGMRAAVMNRPAALNAVNLSMVQRLTELYTYWESKPHVRAVMLKGAGGKAFCAGGDVRALAAAKLDGPARVAAAIAYFRAEDSLVYKIANLSKPHIAIMDGIVMGGGAGLSINGALRVATEKSLFAMPEAVIGFFPDVGATHFLNRLPGNLGLCMALTGLRLRGRELRDVGLATHYVDSDSLPLLMRRLADLGDSASELAVLRNAIMEHESTQMMEPVPADSIVHKLPLIDEWFAGETVEAIDEALAAAARNGEHSEFAASLRAEMHRAAPMSLRVAVSAMRRLRNSTLRECMLTEFRMVVRFMQASDFYEGVRAQLIDKTGAPDWKPSSLVGATADKVEAYFEPLPADIPELELGPEPGGRPAQRDKSDEQQPRRQRSRM